MAHELDHAGRDMDQRVGIWRTGFDQHDPGAVLAQPAGEDAARRAGADDDVVGRNGLGRIGD